MAVGEVVDVVGVDVVDVDVVDVDVVDVDVVGVDVVDVDVVDVVVVRPASQDGSTAPGEKRTPGEKRAGGVSVGTVTALEPRYQVVVGGSPAEAPALGGTCSGGVAGAAPAVA